MTKTSTYLGMGVIAVFACVTLEIASQTAPTVQPAIAREIHVDQHCRILPDPSLRIHGKKMKRQSDESICRLENQHDSDHPEKILNETEKRNDWVRIQEQEYVLQNVTPNPVTFVVEQPVPDKWVVDSDPKPTSYDGKTALFRVQAAPGQVVRLHTGLRRDWPGHAKTMKKNPLAQTNVGGN